MPSGGPRPGSGRRPGADWNGSGEYEKGEQFTATLRPDLHRWLRAQAREYNVSMSTLVNLAVWRMKGTKEVGKE